MSQVLHEDIDVLDAGFGNYQYLPQLAPNQARQRTNFVDGSGPIFSMYLERVAEEDWKMAEGWKTDADKVFLFTGLFSAVVASLITVSIQDLRPNSQDTFYLANIYQALTDPNPSNTSLPLSPPPFSPPTSAIWVNSLWFMSLVISLTCAVVANLLQQWARRYIKVTQPRYSPHKRARIRAFYAEGADKFLLPWVVEALPAMLHLSVFTFFAGLVVFLSSLDLTIFKLALSWVGVCTALYGFITFIPIFRHDSPYHTPLSSLAWYITGIPYVVYGVLCWCTRSVFFHHETYFRLWDLKNKYRIWLLQGMRRAAEVTALKSLSEIDTRILVWTLDSLDEDHELERFFSGLPGFRSSEVVVDPLPGLTGEQKMRFSMAIMGLLDVTFSSNLLPESVKTRRAIICAKVFDLTLLPGAFDIFNLIFNNISSSYSGSMSTEIVQIMSGWGSNRSNGTDFVAAVCMAVARVQRRDDSWFILASDELGVPESVLRDYATHGDNLSLAILIHITRRQFSLIGNPSWPTRVFSDVLQAASAFNAQNTSPELQHKFCTLWNQIVLEAQTQDVDSETSMITWHILRPIRNVYVTLHQGTDSAPTLSTSYWSHILQRPSSYPVCNGHTHDDYASTALSRTVVLASPDAPSSSIPDRPDSLHIVGSTDVPPRDNSRPTLQATIENLHIPATIQDPVTAFLIHGGTDTSATMISLPTPEPPASTPPAPNASISPPGFVTIQHIAGRCTSLDVLDVPSLPSPIQVLDNMPSTESRSSLLPPPSPGPSLSSVPDPGAVEGEGNARAVSHRERDNVLDPLSAIRENIMTGPDLPPQSPAPSLVTDVAIASPPWPSLGAEHTGDHPPRPSHD